MVATRLHTRPNPPVGMGLTSNLDCLFTHGLKSYKDTDQSGSRPQVFGDQLKQIYQWVFLNFFLFFPEQLFASMCPITFSLLICPFGEITMLATVKNYKGNQISKFHIEDMHTFSENLPQTLLSE